MVQEFDGVFTIDTFMHGIEGITAVYLLPGSTPTLIETGPATSLDLVLSGLREIGTEPRLIVLTHIHLDHAGAVGHLAKEFPDAWVAVRAEGAPHIADPSRLWASASRLYPNMTELWGSMLAVDESRIRVVDSDGLVADLAERGRIDAVYTPGHAGHHMALVDRARGDVFAGDALGVYLRDSGVIRPATPPPEFDPGLALDSIEKIRALRPARVFPTHFGPVPDVEGALDEAGLRIRQWVQVVEHILVEGGDAGNAERALREQQPQLYPGLKAEALAKFESTTSYALNVAGIMRFLRKKAESSG